MVHETQLNAAYRFVWSIEVARSNDQQTQQAFMKVAIAVSLANRLERRVLASRRAFPAAGGLSPALAKIFSLRCRRALQGDGRFWAAVVRLLHTALEGTVLMLSTIAVCCSPLPNGEIRRNFALTDVFVAGVDQLQRDAGDNRGPLKTRGLR
jgi:hypothetical protein